MDYNNNFENNNTPDRFNEPKDGGNGIKSVLIGIVSALTVLGLVGGGIWLYNSGKGGSAGSSSTNSTTSISNSSKSAVVVSSSTSIITSSIGSTVSSQAISSITNSSTPSTITTNLTKFENSKFSGLTFEYDGTKWLAGANTGGQAGSEFIQVVTGGDKAISIYAKNDLSLEINYIKVKPSQIGGGNPCLNPEQVLDIGNGWFRVRQETQSRIYINNTIIPDSTCAAEGKPDGLRMEGFSGVTGLSPSKTGSGGFVRITLNGENLERRAEADEIVKTLKW
jgi:hypothetical protein